MRSLQLTRADAFIVNIDDDRRLDLLNEITKAKAEQPSLQNTNSGCWRSEFTYSNIDWLLGNISEVLRDAVTHYLKEDLSYDTRLEGSDDVYFEYWTNVNEPGSDNRLHSHTAFDYVAIYYIQGTDTGDIVFHNPANLMTECSSNSPFVSRMHVSPQDGDLILWPAWVPHEVDTNISDKQRINIAFNIKL